VDNNGTKSWSRWWWDVTVWGTILVTVLVHSVVHEWTPEHTLAASVIGAWVAFSLWRIRRGRHQQHHPHADVSSSGTAGPQRQCTLGRLLALALLAGMVVLILGSDNLMASTTALGVWVAFELIQRRDCEDPLERRPPDASMHHSTRRN
jgi:hypothetical protein